MKSPSLIIVVLLACVGAAAQNVGIGTAAPAARLHVADSSVVFSAAGIVPQNPGNPPIQGSGRRMMWYPGKAAFRVGYAVGTEWDLNNIGSYSFATGYGATASAAYTFSAGFSSKATGEASVAIGAFTTADALYAVAIGSNSQAKNFGAITLGTANQALGNASFAMGYSNIAKASGGTVIGQYNDDTDSPNPNDTASLDRIFQIGNGYYDGNLDAEVRKNALTVLRNGNTGIGTLLPTNKLDVAGDINLTGKLKLNGNTGTAGQYLRSNGNGAAASWQSPTYKQVFMSSLDALITTPGNTFRYGPIAAGPATIGAANSSNISFVEYIMPHAGRIDSLSIQATTASNLTYGGPSTITISVLKNGVGVGFSRSITAQPIEYSVARVNAVMGITFAAGDRLCYYYYIWSEPNTPARVNCSMAVTFN